MKLKLNLPCQKHNIATELTNQIINQSIVPSTDVIQLTFTETHLLKPPNVDPRMAIIFGISG